MQTGQRSLAAPGLLPLYRMVGEWVRGMNWAARLREEGRSVVVVVAIAATRQIAEKNGLAPADAVVTLAPDRRSVEVTATRTVHFTFARVIGMYHMDVHSAVTATVKPLGEAFDYALYSASSTTWLQVNGSDQEIRGHAHANQKLRFNGSNLTVTGRAEGVTG